MDIQARFGHRIASAGYGALLVGICACSGGQTSAGPADDVGGADSRGSGDLAPSEPFTIPFARLVAQDVPWSTTTVRPLEARVERGMDDDATFDPEQTYVELDLAITNRDTRDLEYWGRDSWDLRLATGNRVRPANSIDMVVAPGDTANTTLRYLVPDGTTLDGATLILEGEVRGELEPELIPLDATWQRRYPLRMAPLIGEHFILAISTPDEAIDYTIRDVLVELNDLDVGRADAGRRLVRIDLGAVGLRSFVGLYLDGSESRIIVDGHAAAPVASSFDAVDPGIYVETYAVFSIPADTRQFDLDVRAFYGEASRRFSVNLDTDGALVTD